jgi:lysophospholipase L1-like esterase
MSPEVTKGPTSAVKLMAAALIVPSLFCCREGKTMDPLSVSRQRLQAIPLERWDALSRKKIYFGHQSVGQNVLEGLRAVLESWPGISLDIRETSDPGDFDRPVFAHSRIGQNGDPKGKIDHFRAVLESGIGRKADVALFKFCYVDIDASTDVPALLDHYDRTLADLRAHYPDLTILAVTVPLTNAPPGFKSRIKALLGRGPALTEPNGRRNAVNDHIRQKYGQAVWDLAAVEAMTAGGGKTFVRDGQRTIDLLNPAWTSDGGHLNEVGSRFVATDLLVRLANLEDH